MVNTYEEYRSEIQLCNENLWHSRTTGQYNNNCMSQKVEMDGKERKAEDWSNVLR